MGFVALAGSVSFFAYFAHALFLKYPPVWPDEPFYVDPAIVLIRHGTPGFRLFGNLYPAARSHCLFLPPVYYLYAWMIFSLFGIGIVQARLGSLVLAAAVLILTYAVARRSGLGRSASLFVPSLLALDTLFLRGALIARSDMFGLALILLSICLSAGSLENGSPSGRTKLVAAGMSLGLASLTALMGAGVFCPYLAYFALATRGRSKKVLLPFFAGMSLPLLAWVAYAAPYWHEFLYEFGIQIARKSGRHPLVWSQFKLATLNDVGQYGMTWTIVGIILAAWIAGLVGLLLLARRSKLGRLLLICQFTMAAVFFWSDEIWYGLFLAPLTMLGLAHLATLIADRTKPGSGRFLRRAAGWIAVFLAALMAANSIETTLAVNTQTNGTDAAQNNYMDWARQVSATIPSGSTVLISVIPDPYFVLCQRKDLKLRTFLPSGFRIDPQNYDRFIASADYVLAWGPLPSRRVWLYAATHAQLIRTVGHPPGYVVGIFKMPKSPNAGPSMGAKTQIGTGLH